MCQKSAVVVRNLSKQYGELKAVDSISFEVYRGECFDLLGPNGAGKSTTIKMLTTLTPVDRGKAVISGFSVLENPAQVRARIGYVPPMLSVDAALSGYENLLIFSKLNGLKRSQRQERIREVLKIIGLEDAAAIT